MHCYYHVHSFTKYKIQLYIDIYYVGSEARVYEKLLKVQKHFQYITTYISQCQCFEAPLQLDNWKPWSSLEYT